MHQPQKSSCMESFETTTSGIDIPMEVTSCQVSSCMESINDDDVDDDDDDDDDYESLETTASAIGIPVEVTSSHRQPFVMIETLDLSR